MLISGFDGGVARIFPPARSILGIAAAENLRYAQKQQSESAAPNHALASLRGHKQPPPAPVRFRKRTPALYTNIK
jgi:hypothetical protein